jgi:hypothetical protein
MQRYNQVNVFALFSRVRTSITHSRISTLTPTDSWLIRTARHPPLTARRFQVRYNNIPGQTKPVQPMLVYYSGGYDRTNIVRGRI